MNAHTRVDFDVPEIMQLPLPGAELTQDVGHRFGNQNVAGVATVHNALRDVYPSARNISIGIDIGYAIYGTGVETHAKLDFRKVTQLLAEFHRTPDGRLWLSEEDQRHAVPCRQDINWSCERARANSWVSRTTDCNWRSNFCCSSMRKLE